jgi:hypothetical protein
MRKAFGLTVMLGFLVLSLGSRPAASLASVISTGYVICSCELCSRSDVVCRISPSGYSIPCADYYQAHCKG